MRIVQLANWYSPTSGGLRTAVDAVGRGYVAAGHDRVLVVPGPRPAWHFDDEAGLTITVPGAPMSAGYRMVLSPPGVLKLLDRLAPDSVEVSDKATLTAAAGWAKKRGVRSVLWSHERLDAMLAARLRLGVWAVRPAAKAWTRRLAHAFDAVVVTSWFALDEFASVRDASVARVPLGVDLDTFRPARVNWCGVGPARMVLVGRLSPEKQPELVVETVRALRDAGRPVCLDIVGDGPSRPRMERMAEGLPVTFHGHIAERRTIAAILAAADVALMPCSVESFGLSLLEALACGTPVVAAARGAAPELLAPGAGLAVPPSVGAMAAAVNEVLSWPVGRRRATARRRAEDFPWRATVAGMLNVHEVGRTRALTAPPPIRQLLPVGSAGPEDGAPFPDAAAPGVG